VDLKGKIFFRDSRTVTLAIVRRRAGEPSTLADHARDEIRTLILTGALAPGAPLRPALLGQQLDVSSTVVREALTRLTHEHIVVADAHRGFQVRPLVLDDLRDLTRVRSDIEAIAIRWSVQAGDLDWESGIVSSLHRYVGTVKRAGSDTARADELGAAHEQLHDAFVAACGSPHLLEIRARLFRAAELYRRWTRYRENVRRDVVAEHEALAQACLDRDVERAATLMSEHVERTADLVVEHLAPTIDARSAPAAPAAPAMPASSAE
jgi:DNA-binding GntR family transcriptional regulator